VLEDGRSGITRVKATFSNRRLPQRKKKDSRFCAESMLQKERGLAAEEKGQNLKRTRLFRVSRTYAREESTGGRRKVTSSRDQEKKSAKILDSFRTQNCKKKRKKKPGRLSR